MLHKQPGGKISLLKERIAMFTKLDMVIIGWLAVKLIVDTFAFVYIIWRISGLHK